MTLEFDPILPVLIGLLVLLLWAAAAREVGAKAWLILAVLVLIGFGANPDRATHADAVRKQIGLTPGHHAAAIVTHLMPEMSTGRFEPLAEYHNLGVVSALTLHGKILSIGSLGQVWVVGPCRPSHWARD